MVQALEGVSGSTWSASTGKVGRKTCTFGRQRVLKVGRAPLERVGRLAWSTLLRQRRTVAGLMEGSTASMWAEEVGAAGEKALVEGRRPAERWAEAGKDQRRSEAVAARAKKTSVAGAWASELVRGGERTDRSKGEAAAAGKEKRSAEE